MRMICKLTDDLDLFHDNTPFADTCVFCSGCWPPIALSYRLLVVITVCRCGLVQTSEANPSTACSVCIRQVGSVSLLPCSPVGVFT